MLKSHFRPAHSIYEADLEREGMPGGIPTPEVREGFPATNRWRGQTYREGTGSVLYDARQSKVV